MTFFKLLVAAIAAGIFVGISAFTKIAEADVEASVGRSTRPYPLDVCLVSGEKLGEKGNPVRIVNQGKVSKPL